MREFLEPLFEGSDFVVVKNRERTICAHEGDGGFEKEFLFELFPLGKKGICIPYFHCPADTNEAFVECSLKEKFERLCDSMQFLGFSTKYEYFGGDFYNMYAVFSRRRNASFQRVLEGMISSMLQKRFITPEAIEFNRGFSFMTIYIRAEKPISEIKAMHIKGVIEDYLYCWSNMIHEGREITLFVREIEPRRISYRQLFDALEWEDDRKLLIGMDLEERPVSIDLDRYRRILYYHGTRKLEHSIVDNIDPGICCLVDGRNFRCMRDRKHIGRLLGPAGMPNAKILVISMDEVSAFIYDLHFRKTFYSMLKNDEHVIIFETNFPDFLEEYSNLFDCRIISGMTESRIARYLTESFYSFGFCGFYSPDELYIKTYDRKDIRAQMLI